MLSILVPVYNQDIRQLITYLHQQAADLHIPYEIRCYDDGSYFDYKILNQRLAIMSNVIYREMPENMGRSKIRNKLAEDARYENLLFLDCDSACETDNFLHLYKSWLDKETVVCGGRSYTSISPEDYRFRLHWLYGVKREVSTAAQRRLHPYFGFQTNNFLISREIYQAIKLNEDLTGYGHEDTLFGLELKRNHIPIHHIDNPIRHTGLELNYSFLDKTRQGVANLAYMIRHRLADGNIKLYRAYKFLKKTRLTYIVLKNLERKEKRLVENLNSRNPDIRYFDQLKLLWLLREMRHTGEQ